MVFDGVPPAEQVRQYSSDPELQDQIHSDPSDAVRYIEMNLAAPPFDDPNVRVALNYALDKEGFRQLRGGPLFGELAGHIMVNSLQGNELADYDPYPTPNGRGDVTAAKQAMARSKYDSDGDGVCDDSACDGILTVIDEAISIDQDFFAVDASVHLADALNRAGDPLRALEVADRAQEIAGEDAALYEVPLERLRAGSLLAMGRGEEALEHIEGALESARSQRLLFEEAQLLVLMAESGLGGDEVLEEAERLLQYLGISSLYDQRFPSPML